MKRQWLALSALIGGIAGSTLLIDFNPPAAIAQQPNCKNPQTQFELNVCAGLRAQAADRRLNQVYQQLRNKRGRGTESDRLLVAAEEAWIKYRDANCEFSQKRYEGGTIAPMIYSLCIESVTLQRVRELENYLKESSL